MNQKDIETLAIALPEDILKAKWCGDFDRAFHLIDLYLANEKVPTFMKTRLALEREVLKALPTDYTYSEEDALALVQKEIPDFTKAELDALRDRGAIDWIYINGKTTYSRTFYDTLLGVYPDIATRAGKPPKDKSDRVEFLRQNVRDMKKDGAADLEALNAVAADGRTVADKVTEKSGQTGEKVELVYYAKIEAPMCVTYIHTNHKLGTLIGFNKEIGMEVAKDVAMQAAAMAPISISREDCDPAVIEHERSIGREQARLDGKPEAMLDKIAEGKVNKFLTENTLLSQPLVKNNKLSVGAYIKQDDPQATVVAYKRFSLND